MGRWLEDKPLGGEPVWTRRGGAARAVAFAALIVALVFVLASCGGATNGTAPPAPTITALAAGNAHSLALDSAGKVWAWGSDGDGQVGNGSTVSAVPAPTRVEGLANVTSIAAGDNDSFALDAAGTVWAWGYNGYGQLGDGSVTERDNPVQVKGPGGVGTLANVTAIAAGSQHALALLSDGSVWAWGNNAYGQLGDGTTTDRHAPVEVTGVSNVIAIAAGAHHSLALESDGTVWAWGDNGVGQLGDGGTTASATPVAVVDAGGSGSLSGVIAIAAGTDQSLALKSSGVVVAWGGNGHGQLGDGSTTPSSVPVQVAAVGASGPLTGMIAIAAGNQDSVALGSDGVVRAWGYGFSGELGDGTTTDQPTPVEVGGLARVTGIAAGGAHTLARQRDGAAYAWGDNGFGQDALPTRTLESTTPVRIDF